MPFFTNENLRRYAPQMALILMTVLGGFFRFKGLSDACFWIDEGFSTVNAQAILAHGYPLLPSGHVSWSYAPAHYLMALGVFLFDNLQLGARFFSAVAGAVLIPAFYFMNYVLFRSKGQAVLAAAMLAFLSYEIAWSRQARMYVYLQLWCVLAVAFYVQFLATPRRSSLLLAICFLLLAAFTHTAGVLCLLVMGGLLLFESPRWRFWVGWIKAHLPFTVCAAMFCVGFAALFSHATSPLIMHDVSSRGIHPGSWEYLKAYAYFLCSQLKFVLPFALLGFGYALIKHTRYAVVLGLAVVVYLIVTASNFILFHFRYTLPIVPYLLVFAGLGFHVLYRACLPANSIPRKAGWAGVTLLLLLAIGTAEFQFRPKRVYYLGPTAPQPEWKRAYEIIRHAIEQCVPEKQTAITVSTFPMFHDFYLKRFNGQKFFLPYSPSGYPGHSRSQPGFSQATVITSLQELNEIRGYLVLDLFGIRRLLNKDIKACLNRFKPDTFVDGPGQFDIFIWDVQKLAERQKRAVAMGHGSRNAGAVEAVEYRQENTPREPTGER